MRGRIVEFAQSATWCARVVLGFYVWLLLGVAYSATVVLRLRRLGDALTDLSEHVLDWAGCE
jgi:hypothetical protein